MNVNLVCPLMTLIRWCIHLFTHYVYNIYQGISHSYIPFCRPIGAGFDTWFLAWCCCTGQKYWEKSWRLTKRLLTMASAFFRILIKRISSFEWSFLMKYIIDLVAELSYPGLVTHIGVSKLTILGSENGRRQAIISTNAEILLIGPLGTSFKFHTFSSRIWIWKCRLEMEAILSWPRCVNPYGLGVTKIPFVDFPVREIFGLAKAHIRIFKPHPYLTDVTAAKLRRHLPNMNVKFHKYALFW